MSDLSSPIPVHPKEKSLAELMDRLVSQPLKPLGDKLANVSQQIDELAKKNVQSSENLQILVGDLKEELPKGLKSIQRGLRGMEDNLLPQLQEHLQAHVTHSVQDSCNALTTHVDYVTAGITEQLAQQVQQAQHLWNEHAEALAVQHADVLLTQQAVQQLQTVQAVQESVLLNAFEVQARSLGTQADALQAHSVEQTQALAQTILQAQVAMQQVLLEALHTVREQQQVAENSLAQQGETLERELQKSTDLVTAAMATQAAARRVQAEQVATLQSTQAQRQAEVHSGQLAQIETNLQQACSIWEQRWASQQQATVQWQQRVQRGVYGALLLAAFAGIGAWWPTLRPMLGY